MTNQPTLWHQHDVLVIHMKSGETWRVCRTCGERLA